MDEIDKAVSPAHYEKGVYEPFKIINYYNLNFNIGNIIKYCLRAGKKLDRKSEFESQIQDLKKAAQYIQFEIERLTNLNK